ncbi:Sulfite oxidase [Cytospora mali]|uniref:Nitrate reductase [NADPH] n=1 Tax=Cytospora mali TaxID=578113 RepID=A0A194VJ52_CYTMA|nr:Sulfite oxidase [Valsa mali]
MPVQHPKNFSLATVLLRQARKYRLSASRRSVIARSTQAVHPSQQRSIHTTRPLHFRTSNAGIPTAALLAGFGLISVLAAFSHDPPKTNDLSATTSTILDDRDPSLPRYRLSDVSEHDASHPNPWVTHQDKVYDMTDWISAHPGGDVILRAAGQSIDPYWAIFTIHKQPHVKEILDGYLIGYIHIDDLVDGLPPADAVEDPFAQDPPRDARLFEHTEKPCNAEPPSQELDRDFLTPNGLFYVRNHMWVPVVEDDKADQHTLTIELPDGEERAYTLAELKSRFKTHRVTAVLQCSGNRRSDMTRHVGKTNGLQWGVGAISNAEWEGVRLMDVLTDAGLRVADLSSHTAVTTAAATTTSPVDDDVPDPNTHHVQLTGLEAYGASIPLSTAINPANDVLLAFSMNGQPLTRDHGFPLRAVVPGHVAARSVKWLSKIVVSDEESTSQWQRRDYKSFGPNERAPNWDAAPAIQEMPVTSAITKVLVGECVRECQVAWLAGKQKLVETTTEGNEAQPIAIQGYAVSGGGREITRVDISLDGGQTWDQAELLSDARTGNKAWAWKRWRYIGQLKQPKQDACVQVVVKATDDSYNSQPETHASIFNIRGNLANAWHRVRVCPKFTASASGGDSSGSIAESVVWRTGEVYGCGFQKEAEHIATK